MEPLAVTYGTAPSFSFWFKNIFIDYLLDGKSVAKNMANLMGYPDAYGQYYHPTPTPAAMNYANTYMNSQEQQQQQQNQGSNYHYDPTPWQPSQPAPAGSGSGSGYTSPQSNNLGDGQVSGSDYYYYDQEDPSSSEEDQKYEEYLNYFYNTERPEGGYHNQQQQYYVQPPNDLDGRIRNIRRNDAIFR